MHCFNCIPDFIIQQYNYKYKTIESIIFLLNMILFLYLAHTEMYMDMDFVIEWMDMEIEVKYFLKRRSILPSQIIQIPI